MKPLDRFNTRMTDLARRAWSTPAVVTITAITAGGLLAAAQIGTHLTGATL